MSENLAVHFGLRQKYNSKTSFKLFDAMFDAVPALSTCRDGQRFAMAVYEFQRSCGLSAHECDGTVRAAKHTPF